MKLIPQTDEYKRLRAEALATNWRKKGYAATPKNPHIWGVLMEVATSETVITDKNPAAE